MSKTYFDTVKSYTTVSTEPGVNTTEFLEATEGVVGLFNLLGSTAFGAVTSDMNGNIAKIRAKYETDPQAYSTLQSIVLAEKDDKKKTATQGLLWLLRGLKFTQLSMIKTLNTPTEALSASFTNGYENSLKEHHNFVVKGIFSVAMKACPKRPDFFSKLAMGAPEAETEEQARREMDALGNIVGILEKFYADGNYGKGL